MTRSENETASRKSKRPDTEKLKPHWVEWLTGAFSSLLILSVIAWISYEAVNGADTPAELQVAIASIEKTDAGWQVLFDLRNGGESTAASVEVHGTVSESGRLVEEAAVTFDYVAARSVAHGALIFARNPNDHDFKIGAVGFTDP